MEKLAEFKQPCADLFLHLGPDWQTDIPTTEEGEGAIAYWGDIGSEGNPSDPNPNDPPPNQEAQLVRVRITAKRDPVQRGFRGNVTSWFTPSSNSSSTSDISVIRYISPYSDVFLGPSNRFESREYPFANWSDSFREAVSNTVQGLYTRSINGEALVPLYIEASHSYWLVTGPYGAPEWVLYRPLIEWTVQRIDDNGNLSPFNPIPRPEPPPNTPKKGIVVKEIRNGSEHTVKTISRDSKPQNAEFKCESCEQNCVLMVRRKSDGTAKGLCICKEGLSEEEEKVACEKCKAELLKELPAIVVTKVKAELLTGFKKETKDEIKPELTQEIKGSFDGEFKERIPETLPEAEYAESPNAASSNLVGNVKSALLKDETFLDAIWTAVAAEFAKPENQEELFQSFTGEKIADRIIEISDTDKLKALGAKLIDAIVSVTDDAKLKTLKDKLAAPNNDPNKLTANGVEWTISKVADKVDSVSYVAKDGDSVSTLSNSGSAIITALKAKFAGKNFTIESINANPTTKTYTYNINEL